MTVEGADHGLRRLGQRVAASLDADADGAEVERARERLFEAPAPPARSWPLRLALVAAALGALTLALWGDGAPRPARSPSSAPSGTAALAEDEGAEARRSLRDDGATELVLVRGSARGRLGTRAGPRTLLAGPYRVTGDGVVEATVEGGRLDLHVSEGEVRVLRPGDTPRILRAGDRRALTWEGAPGR